MDFTASIIVADLYPNELFTSRLLRRELAVFAVNFIKLFVKV